MHFTTVSGSHRPDSNSLKVSKFIEKSLASDPAGFSTDTIDLGGNPLPLWDQSLWAKESELKSLWKNNYSEKLSKADGLILVTPEWSGMATPNMKNFLLFCSAKEVGHKPTLIISVSAGRGGSYPVSELRSSGYKNTRICFIPDHIIVRDVEKVLSTNEPETDGDKFIRNRIAYSLKTLIAYARALKPLRRENLFDYENFANGM